MSFLFCCSLYLFGTECSQIFIPFGRVKRQPAVGDLLKGKKRLVKNVMHLFPLIEVIEIVRLPFLLPDMSRLSSPKQRLRHGKRLALLSLLNLTLKLCILSFVLSTAALSHPPPFRSSPTVRLLECLL